MHAKRAHSEPDATPASLYKITKLRAVNINVFVNKDRRISSQKFKLDSTYQNFDEPALQLIPVGHRGLCPAPGAWLAYMIALGRRNRPLQHRLIARSYQTHFTLNT